MRRWRSSLCTLVLCIAVCLPLPLVASPVIGTIDPAVTQANIHETICVPGYSQRVRPPKSVTSRIKRELLANAGLTGQARLYELDHLVSLELGGHPTSRDNLWLQPWAGADGALVKDRIEWRLHRAVCRLQVSLAAAQRCMMQDWQTCPSLLAAKDL